MPKIDKYLIFALIFSLLNAGAIFLIFGFQKYGDSIGYINLIHWFGGENLEVNPWIALRPLGSLIALPFEFLGEGAGLILENIVFYLLGAVLMFKIADLIFNNKKQAVLATLFFVTSTVVIEVGLSYLTDSGAWFFYLLSLFLTLIFFKTKKEWLIVLNGFLSGLGVLMKENGGLGILFFALMVLFSRDFKGREKILKIIYFGIFFFIPVGFLYILFYQYFHYTFWDWYLENLGFAGEGLFLNSLRYLGQFFRILGILWPLVLIGAWQEWQEKNWERIKIYFALLPSSFSFLLWTVSAGGRSVFIFAPLGILLASGGCKKMRPIILALIILAMLVLNYTFVYFNKAIPFTEIIYSWLTD